MKKVFIDGKAGTTGLKIFDRLKNRSDIEIITLSEDKRKDIKFKEKALNSADIAFLCLPDAAAKESVSLINNPDTVVIDTSTAHRTENYWAYGFPELSDDFYNNIIKSKRIAVPGCHASGFISLIFPLIESGAVDKSVLLSCHSITGYSGGGKSMIAEYEADELDELLSAPKQYGIAQQHKHLKEMKIISGIENEPIFCPIVSNFYSGMEMTIPLFKSQLKNGFNINKIREIFEQKYTGPIVKFKDKIDENGFISAAALSGKDSMEITVCGNEERILLVARYDNLGKGASGAAVECLNLVLGTDKTKGLIL